MTATPGAQQSGAEGGAPPLLNAGTKKPSGVTRAVSVAVSVPSGGNVPSCPIAPTASTCGNAAGQHGPPAGSPPAEPPAAAIHAIPFRPASSTLAASSAECSGMQQPNMATSTCCSMQ